jgi:hypothetical protein
MSYHSIAVNGPLNANQNISFMKKDVSAGIF